MWFWMHLCVLHLDFSEIILHKIFTLLVCFFSIHLDQIMNDGLRSGCQEFRPIPASKKNQD